MPLAGRLADLWGARRLFLGALALFTVGSFLAGTAPTLELLSSRGSCRRSAAASSSRWRPPRRRTCSRAARDRGPSGVIGALTFLGMAAGPFLGAAILGSFHPEAALSRLGIRRPGALAGDARAGVALGVLRQRPDRHDRARGRRGRRAAGWETPRRAGRVDLLGAALFSLFLVGVLGSLTMLGAAPTTPGGIDPAVLSAALAGVGVARARRHGRPRLAVRDPFLDPRLFRSASFSSAPLVSGLTGYGFATAIVGGRCSWTGSSTAAPTSSASRSAPSRARPPSGRSYRASLVRLLSLRLVTLVGLGMSIVAPVVMAGWTARHQRSTGPRSPLALFGAGFGLTVTPRSTAAIASVAPEAYGIASSTVTVARMVGMAVGLAILTAYGSTTIDRLYDQVYATPDAYLEFIPETLQDRPLRDPLVVEALEAWAAGEAARIMVGVFLVAAVVTALAVPPSLLLDRRRRMLAPAGGDPAPSGADPERAGAATPDSPGT